MREAVESGLARVDALKPGQGFVEATAGARGEGANVVGFARGELGWRPSVGTALFGFGEATLGGSFDRGLAPAWMVGVGARVTW